MASGDYGYCAKCDEEIEPKRLAHNPATALCINCAR
ncbi:MAG: TraR/DksA family transcriptional regulator [Alphaproteobacteria bacterium]